MVYNISIKNDKCSLRWRRRVGDSMELTDILTIVTIVITWLLGIVAKKSKFIKNNLIPIQNLFIGLVIAIIEWIVTKDFKIAIALSGLIAGGTYDIFHNLEKIFRKDEIGKG